MAIYLCRNRIIELWFIQFANISKLFEIWIIWNIDQLRYALMIYMRLSWWFIGMKRHQQLQSVTTSNVSKI